VSVLLPYAIANEEHHALSNRVPAGWGLKPAQRVESTIQVNNKVTAQVPLGIQPLRSRESAERSQQKQPNLRHRFS
jgi:hypothetical protein